MTYFYDDVTDLTSGVAFYTVRLHNHQNRTSLHSQAKTAGVDELKEAIKAKNPQTYTNVDTNDPKLWLAATSLDKPNDKLTARHQEYTCSEELLALT
ncbi:hypothetical protein BC936DRAFT_138349 [Jimgerdemannia flammicorona]|uniref:Crinkler effector protein N-terminal domain-containing protein n=1 Tax=Jimgerdemannia flammicorona TaxID=994334 RepID=A0A433DIE3_9FUNG|nr:hypothetical protein BC936DRAFT_138349 [Jimgerdemannia flammicorona]